MLIQLRKVIAVLGGPAVAATLGIVAGAGAASAAPLTGTLRITVTNPTGAPDSAELTVHSATTGEVAANGYFGDGSYRLLVLVAVRKGPLLSLSV